MKDSPPTGVSMHLAAIDRGVPRLAMAAALLVFIVLVFPLLKSYPYSDDWSYLTVLVPSGTLTSDWLIALHNDHRIPIQKLLHVLLLKLTGGDFRSLVLLNVMAALLASAAWVGIASSIRGGRHAFGDAIIPLLLLCCGFNTVSWGFNFSFVSSIALVSACAWAWAAYARGFLPHGVELAFIALTLCAWTGGNGIIGSVVMGAFLLLACLLQPGGNRKFPAERVMIVSIWATSLIGLALVWKPSIATSAAAGTTPEAIVLFLQGMVKSWLGVYAMGADGWKTAFAVAVIVAGMGVCLARAWRSWRAKGARIGEMLLLLAVLTQSLVTICVVAISRAGAQPWSPGLELHYGYLTILIPVCCWVAISTAVPRRLLSGLSLVALAGVAFVYVFNVEWRVGASRDGYSEVVAAEAALLSGMPARKAADEHIRQLYYVDTPDARSSVTGAIELLRTLPLWRSQPEAQ